MYTDILRNKEISFGDLIKQRESRWILERGAEAQTSVNWFRRASSGGSGELFCRCGLHWMLRDEAELHPRGGSVPTPWVRKEQALLKDHVYCMITIDYFPGVGARDGILRGTEDLALCYQEETFHRLTVTIKMTQGEVEFKDCTPWLNYWCWSWHGEATMTWKKIERGGSHSQMTYIFFF